MSEHIELASPEEALEYFFEKGWTDGLPVIPPTPKKVQGMLKAVNLSGGELIGQIPARNVEITAEMIAVNAVMAGCLPSYMPVVLAAARAVLDPAFGVHGVTASTGGAAILIIVNGPIVRKIGLNTGRNFLGTGNRANATIGRAIHLMLLNAGKTREFDQSTMGNPGKYTFCIAEAENEVWLPLHVERGFSREVSTVTVLPTEAPNQITNHISDNAEMLLLSFADRMNALATFNMQRPSACCIVVCPEHQATLVEYGWDKARIRKFLFEKARRSVEDIYSFGLRKVPPAAGETGFWTAVKSPDDILVVAGGGPAGRFSAYIPNWGSLAQYQPVTKLIEMPEVGADSVLKAETVATDASIYDVIIAGAGPAGLTAAIGLAGVGLKTGIVESALPGGQMVNIPEIENFPGQAPISGSELASTLFDQARKLGVDYIYGEIEEIRNASPYKSVKLQEAVLQSKAVIVATGSYPRQLGVPGEQRFMGQGVSYCALCDGGFFKGQEVVVVGGGDSAVDEAIFLAKLVKKVTIVHRGAELRAQTVLKKRAQQMGNIDFIVNHAILEIRGGDSVEAVLIRDVLTGEERELSCAGVFVYIGMLPRFSAVEGLGVTNQEGWIQTDETMATAIPGLFAIGDVRDKPLRHIATAIGDGSMVAYAVARYVQRSAEFAGNN